MHYDPTANSRRCMSCTYAPGSSTATRRRSPTCGVSLSANPTIWVPVCVTDGSRDHAAGADGLVRGWPASWNGDVSQSSAARSKQEYWLPTPPPSRIETCVGGLDCDAYGLSTFCTGFPCIMHQPVWRGAFDRSTSVSFCRVNQRPSFR